MTVLGESLMPDVFRYRALPTVDHRRFTRDQEFGRTVCTYGGRPMSSHKSPDTKGTNPLQNGGTGSHLAHWPPPGMGRELKPLAIKHGSGEHIRHGTRRGWRLTRAMFSEFEGGED
jgi:hypothetical protein